MNSFIVNKLKQDELKTIGHYSGYVCILIGLFMLAPIITALAYHDAPTYLNAFIISSAISIAIGIILFTSFRSRQLTQLSLKGSLIFVLSIWGITALLAGLPYFVSGDLGFIDSIFQGMSGITTTGFSLIPAEETSFSICLWEALTQWFGGLGIIVLLLVVVPSSVSLKRLYFAEGKTEQMTPNIKHTIMIFIKLYLLLTAIGIVLYLLIGLDLFDAICYCFCGIATGGFSVDANHVEHFSQPLMQLVTIIIMILGSTNFVLLYRLFKGNTKQLFKDEEVKAMAIIIIFGTVLIALSLYFGGYYHQDIVKIFSHSLFQVVSVMSSTGFTTTDITAWPSFCYHILIILMFIGGSVCSTSGGLKIYNIVVMIKSIWWEVQTMLLPKNTIIVKKIYHDNKYRDVSNDNIRTILIYIIAYILIFLVSSMIILLFCNNLEIAYSLAASSLGNTGVGPDYFSITMPLPIKIIMIIDFWVGRIGVWPLLLLIVYGVSMVQGKIDDFGE